MSCTVVCFFIFFFRFTTVMNIVIVISNWTYSFAVLFSLLRTVVRVALRFLVMPSNRLDGRMDGWFMAGCMNEKMDGPIITDG